MKELPLHPLINKDIKHYDSGTKSAIEQLEEEYTVDELITFSKINIFKYGYRSGAMDTKKVNTYTTYLTLLKRLESMGFGSMKVKNAYAFTNKEWRYV